MTRIHKNMTPPEFDAAELALMQQAGKVAQQVGQAEDEMHRLAFDEQEGRGRQRQWKMSLAEVEEVLDRLSAPGADIAAKIARGRERHEQLSALLTTLQNDIAAMEETYSQAPWTRWYPCLNADGHIHRDDRNCPTLHRMGQVTAMGWETRLSGQPVGAVIADLGPRLCSVCFPDAPAEHCRSLSDITRAEREAKKADRAKAKFVKSLRPDERFRTSGDRRYNELVETVAKCKQLLRDEVELRDYYGRGEHSRHADSVNDAAQAARVLLAREAAAPGTGAAQAEIDRIIANAVKANRKNGARLGADGSVTA